MGTAAWKFIPDTGVLPVTWNRAKIFTTPGLCGEVCGVSEIRSSFLSYAGYAVNFGAGAAAGCGGDCACGSANADGAGAAAAGGGGDVAAATEGVWSNKPRMSSTVLFCFAAGAEAPAPGEGAGADELPKISARRSWLLRGFAAGAPFVGAAVAGMSSPSRLSC